MPIAFNGSFHLHYYPGLAAAIRDFRPHIVHIDEEPYNLAAWQAIFMLAVGAKTLFFSWQNIYRHYPPPFSWGEHWVLNKVDYALMGTDSAAQCVARKATPEGWRLCRSSARPSLFQFNGRDMSRPYTIGYVGRLVREKGVHLLLDAARACRTIGGCGLWAACRCGRNWAPGETLGYCRAHQVGGVDGLHRHAGQYQQLDALVICIADPPQLERTVRYVLLLRRWRAVSRSSARTAAQFPDIIGDASARCPRK